MTMHLSPAGCRRDVILGRHRAAIRALADQPNAISVALVGSVARGTDRPDGDCDFLCRFAPGATLVDIAGLEIALEEMLGCPVQLSCERMLEGPHTSMLDDAIPLQAPQPAATSGRDQSLAPIAHHKSPDSVPNLPASMDQIDWQRP